MIARILALAAGLVAAGAVAAAEIREVTVEHRDGRYYMHSETWFDAPRLGVFDVLTDYDRFHRISSIYEETRFEPPAPDGTPRVFTRVVGCVLFFCRSMTRTERLETDGPGFIRAVTEAGASDFRYAVATWRLTDEGGGTRVIYAIEMEPAFWVPPVIGPYVMKRKLVKGGRDAVQRIEALARESRADTATFRARGLAGFGAGS